MHCLANTCIHRGASLADGKVRDGEVQCPYHGWRFAGERYGDRPSAVRAVAPVAILSTAVAVGFLWMFVG